MSRYTLRYIALQIRNVLFVVVIFILLIVYRDNKIRTAKVSALIPRNAIKYLEFEIVESPEKSLDDLKSLIQVKNEYRMILNSDSFGPIKMDTIIFVILVKKLTMPLKFLVASLSEIRGIEDALIIFSHSIYDENLNTFISTIDFCRVMQLFYPYSVQAHPNTYPGFDPNDCPYDMSIEKARRLNCTGTPDLLGKYRQPSLVESKLHWWWTSNMIFENLTFSDNYEGTVVFLDDDLYLLEDFLYMVIYMKEAADSKYSRSEFLSLGSSDLRVTRREPLESKFHSVNVATWNPQHHSSALAFDSAGWNRIVTHYDLFCSIDDYSWSRSLLQISMNLKDNSERILVMSAMLPRAFKISEGDQLLANNIVLDNVLSLLAMQAAVKDFLYPPIIEVYTEIETPYAELDQLFNVGGNGGWNDPRDKMLCANITIRKIKMELFDTAVAFRQEHLVI